MFDRTAPPPVKRKSWLARLFTRKKEPSTFTKFLAVHMHFCEPGNRP